MADVMTLDIRRGLRHVHWQIGSEVSNRWGPRIPMNTLNRHCMCAFQMLLMLNHRLCDASMIPRISNVNVYSPIEKQKSKKLTKAKIIKN